MKRQSSDAISVSILLNFIFMFLLSIDHDLFIKFRTRYRVVGTCFAPFREYKSIEKWSLLTRVLRMRHVIRALIILIVSFVDKRFWKVSTHQAPTVDKTFEKRGRINRKTIRFQSENAVIKTRRFSWMRCFECTCFQYAALELPSNAKILESSRQILFHTFHRSSRAEISIAFPAISDANAAFYYSWLHSNDLSVLRGTVTRCWVYGSCNA